MIILRTWSFRKDVKKKIVFPFPRQKINLRQHFEKDILPFALPPQFFLCLLSQSLSPFPHITAIVLPPEPKPPYANMIGFWLSSQNPHFPCSQNELPARKKTTGRKKSAGEGKYTVLKGLLFEIVVNMCAFMFTCGIENTPWRSSDGLQALRGQLVSETKALVQGGWGTARRQGTWPVSPSALSCDHRALNVPSVSEDGRWEAGQWVWNPSLFTEAWSVCQELGCPNGIWTSPGISEQMLRIPNEHNGAIGNLAQGIFKCNCFLLICTYNLLESILLTSSELYPQNLRAELEGFMHGTNRLIFWACFVYINSFLRLCQPNARNKQAIRKQILAENREKQCSLFFFFSSVDSFTWLKLSVRFLWYLWHAWKTEMHTEVSQIK